jgi:hypothetical protein
LKTKTRPSVAWANVKGQATKMAEPLPKHGETDDLRWRDYKTSGLVKQGRENWTKYIPGGAVSNLDMRELNESRNLQHSMKAANDARPSTAQPHLLTIIHDLQRSQAKLRDKIHELKYSRHQADASDTATKTKPVSLAKLSPSESHPIHGVMTLEHNLICRHERESKVKRQLGESGEPLCKEIMKGIFYGDSRDPCVVDPYRLKKRFLMAPGPGITAPLGLESTLRNIKYQEMATQSTTVCADIVQGRFMLESEGKKMKRAASAPRNFIQANARQASLTYSKLKCDRSKYDWYFPDRASDSVAQIPNLNSPSKPFELLTFQQKKSSNELLLKLSEKVSQKRGGDQMLWRAFKEIGDGKTFEITSSKELKSILTKFHILASQEDIENLQVFLKEGLKEGHIKLQHFRLRMEQSHLQ